MSDVEKSRCDEVCARFNAAPYYALLGMVAESEGAGRARVTLPLGPKLLQLYGGIHGGALLSLADAALNVAVATTFEGDEKTATVDVTMHFIAPAGANDVIAEGRVTHRGGRLVFAECVLSAGSQQIARAQGVCYVARPSPPTP